MTPEKAIKKILSEFDLKGNVANQDRWEDFCSIANSICTDTEYVEWSLKYRNGNKGDKRVLWACPPAATNAVADKLQDGLLRNDRSVHRQLTNGALIIGLAWDANNSAIKIYSTLRPDVIEWGSLETSLSQPPISPTYTLGFVREQPEGPWRKRYYLFWKTRWIHKALRNWLTTVVGESWTAALSEEDRGGIILRENGSYDLAIGFTNNRFLTNGSSGNTKSVFSTTLNLLAAEDSRVADNLGNVTWITFPLSSNKDTRSLRDVNLYFRPPL